MVMLELPQDFKELLKLFQENSVRYLLIGGYAVGIHGYPRPTGDIDIWVSDEIENARRVAKSLRTFGFKTSQLSDELMSRPRQLVRIGEFPLRVEIMNYADALEFEKCFGNRLMTEIDGIEISVIGLKDLKANKKAVGRLKDLSDIENLP
jgi:predicted nucleotidyltransferase